jgi:hypothetical protein
MKNVNRVNKINEYIEEYENMKNRYNQLLQSILFMEKLQKIREQIQYQLSSTTPPDVDYRDFTYSSWGMESDPAPGKGYHVQLFSHSLYQKLYLDVFSDLQLKNVKLEFIFDTGEERNLLQPILTDINTNNLNSRELFRIGFKIINESMTQEELNTINRQIGHTSKGKPIYEFKRDSKDSRPHFIVFIPIGKAMNRASLINDVIRVLLEKHYGKMIKNKNPGMGDNIMMGQSNTTNPPIINFNSINYKKDGDKDYFEVYDKIIRILLKMNYNIYELTRFILRFKILGDKLQGLEAKYNCTLINQFKSSPEDIFVKRRVLVTQDRPLNAYAQVEGDINFLSKATIEGIKLVYWNFGDADTHFDVAHLEESLAYVPITSLFTMGKSIKINEEELNTERKNHMRNMNRLENELKNKKVQLESPTPIVLPVKKTKSVPKVLTKNPLLPSSLSVF